ncbi:MAG: hypothetical protein LBV67_00455 [Streptococcaceae bacterium]|nr:hypothetical protein [Streptococcaceae bacterium]
MDEFLCCLPSARKKISRSWLRDRNLFGKERELFEKDFDLLGDWLWGDNQQRAEYGKYILSDLAKVLSKEYGSGFFKRILELARQFFVIM